MDCLMTLPEADWFHASDLLSQGSTFFLLLLSLTKASVHLGVATSDLFVFPNLNRSR